ncbi:hypothetical protein AXJ18_gp027 [Streptomyces phage Jay2Jay]|uniref:Uncharacterized protein n=2 Tax=Samistivirus jay2jay TaxID=2560786 RepID=A0A221SAS2_9CAUD|nr:hypothetical protein AXJ18_gp027 [Streptomyces phage Jay2Jay]AIW02526.1 hypothetical protein PBI_JAY2JAY_27 [Streptomyces phage Jay2Jay]ASN73102.1 hypothetical protein SEA_WARPY_27 [Streptomyces phage Warpy]UEM46811.1 hypothetical protein SEA_TARGARYEN_22 [Streptomyces phage Targaryen]
MSDEIENDVFDEDTSSVVNTIMLMRIYDMLTCIARGVNPQEAEVIFRGHQLGKIFGPAPSFDMGDELSEPDTTEE